jgi:prepilin-type N-terminal cleavage/methylation domain-containing protein
MLCVALRAGGEDGFTLIEALVALVVVALVVGVILQTQLATLNMEQAVHATRAARLEGDRIYTEVRLGAAPTNILLDLPPDAEVTVAVTSLAASEDADCTRWDIGSKIRPSFNLPLITRSF